MKIPKKYEGILFAFVMSLLMALLMSAVLTLVFTGLDKQFVVRWMNGFVHAWPIAFPSIFIIAPLVKKIVVALVE
ncbi:MAG TPA: DUF2798 domain-containing protein [Methylotenera sp.]|nr:DUF2798 domain-containing protein [Methylotenera sp.]